VGKVIKFLILATFFLCGDALGQSKISNPPTPPPQAPQYDEYNSDNRFNDFRSSWYREAEIKSEGIKYNEEGLKPYLDDNFINLLKDLYKKKLERFPECVRIDFCNDTKTKRLNFLVGTTYSPKYKAGPVYPTRALENGTQGYVIVAFDINKKGAPENIYKVESSCTLKNGKINKGCEVFDKAVIKAAEKVKYYPATINGKPVEVTNVPHKYTFELEGQENQVVVDYPKRILRKIEQFTNRKQWVLLEDYARDLHGRYELKYYWIAEAQFHKQNFDDAKINYKRLLSFDAVADKVKGSARERLLQMNYSENNFNERDGYCTASGSYIQHYLCGLNYLTIGDSTSGVYFFIRSLRQMKSTKTKNGNLQTTMLDLMEMQRDYLFEDLSKLN
jgi:TonB family protein|tara:strand:- start:79 stop:1245 length:1167 start_codon:yes stop_codon:yes gene_type:complete